MHMKRTLFARLPVCLVVFCLTLCTGSGSMAQPLTLSPEEQAFILQHPEIVLAGGSSFEPFLIRNKDGTISGYDVDVINLINERTGLNITFELGLWKTVQQKADNRELDGLSTAGIVDSRLALYNNSIPYVRFTSMVFVRKGNPAGIYSPRDFDGKRVALQEGNRLFEQLLSSLPGSMERIYYPRINDLLRAVIAGEADFTILDESSLYVAGKIGLKNFIETVFPVGPPFDLVFSLRNDWPELVSIVNKGLSSFSEKEKMTLRNRWFGALDRDTAKKDRTVVLTGKEKDFIHAHPTIRVATQLDWPPFDFNDSGKATGLAMDLVAILAQRVGLQVDYVQKYTWPEQVELFKNKKIDVLPVTYINHEISAFTLYTEPYYRGKLGVFINTDASHLEVDLRGKKVGIRALYGSRPLINEKMKGAVIVALNSNIDLVRQLATNKLDAIIGNPFVFYQLAREYQFSNIQLSSFVEMNQAEQRMISLHIGVRKDWPILHQIMQKTLASVAVSELETLKKKWADVAIMKRTNWKVIVQTACVVALLLLVLIWHNRSLKATVAKKTLELNVLNENLESTVQDRTRELVAVNTALNETIGELKTLRGIIPICASCKKIRDDSGSWNMLEAYITKHSLAEFSHGICPDCVEKLYPDIDMSED